MKITDLNIELFKDWNHCTGGDPYIDGDFYKIVEFNWEFKEWEYCTGEDIEDCKYYWTALVIILEFIPKKNEFFSIKELEEILHYEFNEEELNKIKLN